MRTPRRKPDTAAPPPPVPPVRGRRAHAGPPAEEPHPDASASPGQAHAPGGQVYASRPTYAPGELGAHVPGRGAPVPAAFAVGPASAGADPSGRRPGAPGPTTYGHGASDFAAAAAATTGFAPHGRGRPRVPRPGTVRAKIVSLLMVPVVSLLALWAFATVSTAQDIARADRAQQTDDRIRTPLDGAVAALQAERGAAVRFLADPAATDRAAALREASRRTTAAVDRLRLGDAHTVADSGGYPAELATRLRVFVAAADALGSSRTGAAEGRTTPDAAYAAYTAVVDSALGVGGALSGGPAGPEAESGAAARVLLEFGRAAELLSREDALLAVPGPRGAETLQRLAGTIETRRTLTDAAARDLPAAQRSAWQAVLKSAGYADLTAAEDRTLGNGNGNGNGSGSGSGSGGASGGTGGREVQGVPTGWDPAYAGVGTSMRDITSAAHAGSTDRTGPLAQGLLSPSGAAVLLGLAAVAASLVISVRVGRGLVVELVSLRNGALEIAHRKLPHAMERLRAGQHIDVLAEAPPGQPAEDEVAQVGAALSTVHRAALSAAVERAELADGVSGVFVNLARRSQVLVHKQLTLLDSMERRADDPNELGDLFRLDHLTTRMRRHAESLIILSGAAPGRAWRLPVPLTNVVRAAVSEIEDYPRVEVRGLAEAGVVGGAVADLTHLLAELIENATQFSPPHTKVRVSGEPVGTGYVLEIEDRGLGMGREALADANRRIEQSEALDLFDSDRLGLFVVSRLSARHGVRVQLRTSPYGGTTAVVLMPNALLQGTVTADGGAEPGAVGVRPERPVPPPTAVPRVGSPPAVPPAVVPAAGAAGPAGAAGQPGAVGDAGPSGHPGGSAERDPRPAPVAALRMRDSGGAGPRTPFPSTPSHAPTPTATPTPARAPEPEPVLAGVTELPRRVRQASLVPQLREAPAARAATAPRSARTPQDPPGRSPEEARERMAAYRAGWARGAQDATPVDSEGAE
ncbi:nitrate- and nitrite sensing domain-containing protein [Streptomyces sp. G-G2]|uniref:sensor histidine kinase n=1 Tax=Streptomyces sp. G-G2 TaxID=3046201 RepID=UPI0024B8AC35|nr:nitrate- and nitrite sensing domain-containing protein [Streptomyces sp. G-G2]MDJ0381099.1 nitrate- and nitrite sensing domain-containing protein [Streptomyces sp. G-G2]